MKFSYSSVVYLSTLQIQLLLASQYKPCILLGRIVTYYPGFINQDSGIDAWILHSPFLLPHIFSHFFPPSFPTFFFMRDVLGSMPRFSIHACHSKNQICFSKRLGYIYCSCVTILPMLIQSMHYS